MDPVAGLRKEASTVPMLNAKRPVLAVVDDEDEILEVIARFAEDEGFEVVTHRSGREAMAGLQRRKADMVMVDLRMPDVSGLDVIRAIQETDSHCQIVLMTGYASIETAVEAVRLGARDYLTKPVDFKRLRELLLALREDKSRRRSVLTIEAKLARRLEFCGMIGRAPVMRELFDLIRRLAPHVRTALVTGETGSGKELVARALHQMGPRRNHRLVSINCSAVVETLFESELFGHVRGAFTGATENKRGLFEVVDGGTLFLDEVAELSLAMQAKLLRVLDANEVQRVGSLEPRPVDVHVIAATNRDLPAALQAGRFRSDLFYRLNAIVIPLPALRERREDIPYLTAAFVREFAMRLGKPLVGLTPTAERLLASAPWEGNVRQLRNVIERACILATGEFITDRELPELTSRQALEDPSRLPGADAAQPNAMPGSNPHADGRPLSMVERDHIVRTLQQAGGNKAVAARRLGISRRAFYRRLQRHALV